MTHGSHRRVARAAAYLVVTCFAATACRSREETRAGAASGRNDVPVAINSESPFRYPAALYDQGVDGEVRLRLFVDALGRVHPESTRVASSSGTPELDSAAVRGAAQLRFAPANKNGMPVAMTFFQPVIFRRAAAAPGAPVP